jgi:DEAD/DEAH box helicase domain-containing protein
MNTKQQAGRAGRGNQESIVALVASSNALDQYYMRYPKEFFERNCEEAVLNVSNPYIQAGHVLCAAKEIPLTVKDEKYFGSGLARIIELLESEGLLTGGDSKSAVDPNPHGQVSIRGIDRDAYSIFAFNGGRRVPIEKDIEKALAFKEAFEGAIYLHMGTPYHVSKLDHEKKEIHVEETKAEYYTKALVNSEIFIKERYTEKPLPSCNDSRVGLGAVEVVEQVTGYKKFRYFSETIIGEDSLEMPKLSLETVALWVELPDRFADLVETHSRDFAGGIHAIEHAMIAMYPLRLLADRNDVGGVSTPGHNDLDGKCGIFVYDGHRGGVGYAEKGYEIISDILEVTLKAIEGCQCSDGCPSCIQSPKCGNHNNPLDKDAALMILNELLGKPPYVPKKAKHQKSPVSPPKNSDKTPGIGAALDRVRSQLRREAIKPKESKEKLSQNTKTKSFETPNSTKYQPQERSPSKNEGISWDDRLKEIRKIHPRAYESWGDQEEIRLKKLFNDGSELNEISKQLGRQKSAIRSRLQRLGLIDKNDSS